jgi:hypothetical protein
MITTDGRLFGWAWSIRGLPRGSHRIVHIYAVLAPGAGIDRATVLSVGVPVTTADLVSLTDAQRLEQIKDVDMHGTMSNFLQIRSELVSEGVTEDWYLQSYARYVVGADPAYTNSIPLTPQRVTAIKAVMLNPELWPYMADLTGFLTKVFDDVASLTALAQSTDFE